MNEHEDVKFLANFKSAYTSIFRSIASAEPFPMGVSSSGLCVEGDLPKKVLSTRYGPDKLA